MSSDADIRRSPLLVGDGDHPAVERTWTFTTALPTSAHSARTHLGDALTEWGLPGELIDDAQMIVSELAGNAVRYGEGAVYHVRLRRDAGGLLIEVADDSEAQPVMRSPDDGGDEQGRGLIVVNALATAWGACPSAIGLTKVVWALLATPARPNQVFAGE